MRDTHQNLERWTTRAMHDEGAAASATFTFVDMLRWRAANEPDRPAHTFLEADGSEASITNEQLDRHARAIAAALVEAGVAAGERALLLYPPGLEYIAGFFGCLYAGVVAVPAYPPDPARIERTLPRLQAIASDAKPRIALTVTPILAIADIGRELAPSLARLPWIATDALPANLDEGWQSPPLAPRSLAFLQYTSGSTGAPRGVMLTHENLIHNSWRMRRSVALTPHSTVVSWLPPYHDMGLIGAVLQQVFVGARTVLMSPLTFLRRPLAWLEAIDRHRGVASAAPNFAYDLCVRRSTPEERAALDLRSWEFALNGAEPVRAETMQRFAEAFAPAGFRAEAFYPCYGLAETTLFVSGRAQRGARSTVRFDARALEAGRGVVAEDASSASVLVGCGRPPADQRIEIVDPASGTPQPRGHVGEIWLASPSVAAGYFGRSEETEATFGARLADGSGPFLRTGDLAFFHEGELFVTGRLKDLIILRGRNVYPQDLEATAEKSHPALRRGCAAAFAIEHEGEERAALVIEVDQEKASDPAAAIAAIRRATTEEHDVELHAIVLIVRGSIGKTSSGKIQRRACRDAFLAGALEVVAEARAVEAIASPPPRAPGEVETWLVAALASSLRRAELDVRRPLVEVGLDSLRAVELAAAIEQATGVVLPLGELLGGASLTELARALEVRTAGIEPPMPTPREAVERTPPLSVGQQAMWFLHRLDPANPAYIIAGKARLRGTLSIPALRRAFEALLLRHDALRATFSERDGAPVQHISVRVEAGFAMCEAKDVSDAQIDADALRPFDLEHGPLLRLAVYARSEAEHVLTLAIHHIVADFWSITVLLDELGALYAAAIAGLPARLPPATPDAGEHAREEAARLGSAERERLEGYWERALDGTPVLELPTDRPRPPVQRHRGRARVLRLGAPLTERLSSLARAEGATMHTTLLSAFAVLLHRWSGQDDFAIGVPTAARGRAGRARTVGYLVNPVAIRAELSAAPTFVDVLHRTQRTVIAALEHRGMPFPRLVERLQPVRDPARSPIFQVTFAWQRAPSSADVRVEAFALGLSGETMPWGGLELESAALTEQPSPFDLALSAAEIQGEIVFSALHDVDLFDSETIDRLLESFRALLEGIVASPGARIAALPLLSEAERHRLIDAWNQTRSDYPRDKCIHELFAEEARRRPDAIAVTYGDEELTYAELDARANQLARRLRALGVRRDVPVAVCMPRSIELIVALVGTLKAGGGYMPIDPSHPRERVSFLLEDMRPPVVLTERRSVDTLPSSPAHVLCVDEGGSEGSGDISVEGGDGAATPDSLAYVLYTSGSTGAPKGVCVPHRAVVRLVRGTSYADLGAHHTFLLFSPLTFDASVFQLWGALLNGARLVVFPAEFTSIEQLARVVKERGITTLLITTSIFEELIDGHLPALRGVRQLLTGGDVVSPVHATRALGGLPGCVLINAYGPTENTVLSTTYAMTDPRQVGASVSIGTPVSNSTAYILDARLEPVPIGVIGEIYTGGDGLALGYANRPSLTAESFIANPFSSTPGARLYRTGDRGRYLADGRIDFAGRVDDQVKIRGIRVEPAEVATALGGHPRVRGAFVVPYKDARGDDQLCAYVVTADGAPLPPAELRGFLRRKLPEPMVPAAFVRLESMPKTTAGKIDRRALPAPAMHGGEQGFIAPRTRTEAVLAGLLQDLLGGPPLGAHDDFFERGGHSLLAARVVSRVRSAFGVELPLRALFEVPRLADLAARVDAARSTTSATDAPAIERISRGGPLPASFAQERLWFLDRLEPGSTAYTLSQALRIGGPLDAAVLQRALDALVERHEALRTTFAGEAGAPVQRIAPSAAIPLALVDVHDHPSPEGEAQRLAADEARRPFDLARGPLLRATLLHLGEREHVLLLSTHHIVSDGWSVDIFMHELFALYAAFARGAPHRLRDLPIQYADWAVFQRRSMEGAAAQAKLAHWTAKLASPPPPLDLSDGARPEAPATKGARRSRSLSTALTRALKTFAQREHVTLFMTLLAALGVLLRRVTGRDDIIVGSPIASRDWLETEGLIGLFLNTLALRIDVSGDPTFRELCHRVRETVLSAEANKDVPFERIVAALPIDRDLGASPLFDVMLNVVNVPRKPLGSPAGLTIEPLETPWVASKYALTVYVEEADGALAITMAHRVDVLSEERAGVLLDQLETLLEQIVAAPARSLRSLSLVTPGARRLLPDPAAKLPSDAGKPVVEQLFERARVQPDHPALLQRGRASSYGDLAAAATAIARALVASGTHPGDVVAVLGSRSFGLIAAMVGAMAARGVLLALDPDLPDARLELMLRAAHARILVCVGDSARPLAGAPVQRLDVDAGDGWPRGAPPVRGVLPEPRPADPAYIFFTSGTTATPRAVLGWHKGLGHFIDWQRTTFDVGPNDRVAQLTGLSFDVVLRDIFTALTGGATLCLPDENEARPDRILSWLDRTGITLLHAVPTRAASWFEGDSSTPTLRALRWVFFAGEPLTGALVRRWRAAFPAAGGIVNLYGPTETTLAKCYHEVGPEPAPGVQPIGKPLPGAQALILGEDMQPCGLGEIGEIVLRTPYRSLGYLGAPEETARRFVPNPFTDDPEDLVYRTGDLGRYRVDGALEIRGRLDHQVKIGGVRVEPDEVAAVLARHPDVQSCVVVARKNEHDRAVLVAYAVPAPSATAHVSELARYLGRHLPAAMVPSAYVLLERLPLTPNGKVDRAALPAPSWGAASTSASLAAPRSDLERRLAAVWTELLGVEEVGVDENFFALGGHSLLAMQLASRVRDVFHADLPLRTLFEAPTVRELALAIVERSPRSTEVRSIVPAPGDRLLPFPLTNVQTAYWIGRDAELELGAVATQGYRELDLLDLDLAALERALDGLVARHDMLRAIVLPDGRQQVLERVPRCRVEAQDLRGLGAEEVTHRMGELRERLSRQRFALDRWPLFEIRASILDDRRTRLHVAVDAMCLDAWSARIALRDLLHIYRRGAAEDTLPSLQLAFRDYVLAEAAAREAEPYQRARAYWMGRIAELPAAPELPMAKALGMLSRPWFARRSERLERPVWSELKRRAAGAGLTPSVVLLAAYAEILATFARSPRFTLNVTLFNRRGAHPGVNEIIGNFSSLTLLEANLASREPFEVVARRLQDRLWSDLDHGDFGGVEVLRELRRASRRNLGAAMPIVFTSLLGLPAGESAAGLAESDYGVTQSSQVYLNHGVSEVDGALAFHWDAIEEVFPDGLLDAMFAKYVELLQKLASTPHGLEQRASQLVPVGRSKLAAPSPAPPGLLHTLFQEQAARRPQHPAVMGSRRTLTYGELHRLATHLGARLRALGARPGHLVAVVMEKGWEQVVAVLSILSAGAAYLPIDPSLPEARVHAILKNGEVTWVLTQSWIERTLRFPDDVECILVDRDEPGDEVPAPLEPIQGSNDLAYVMYTSGSTGEPKGVMIDHRGAVNTIVDINTRFFVNPEDRVLGLSSLSFDLSVYDVFGTLSAGATLVLPDAQDARDPAHWADLIARHRVTLWNTVPALLQMLVAHVSGEADIQVDASGARSSFGARRSRPELGSLRLALLSGDWIPVTLPDRIRALQPGIQVVSLGGATEASIWSILYPIERVDPGWKSIPYGQAMARQGVYVLDHDLSPRPIWATGELFIGGIGVAQGYWRDDEKTRARFIAHPELGRLYRTGDLGRLLPDGNIEFLGREDSQVKIRGHRIELGEIETALRSHPGVREAVAAVREATPGDKRLAAYVVPKDPAAPPTELAWRDHLRGRLPEYMVPTAIVSIAALPLSANGKIDRDKLPPPDKPSSDEASPPLFPRTPHEAVLQAVWQDVLGVAPIGVESHFFEIGGDSLMAIQVVRRAARAGLHLSVREIFQHTTIASLAEVVAGRASAACAEPEHVEGEVPLTPIQRWFFAQELCDVHHWNQALLLEVRRPIDPAAMSRAVEHLIAHHDALRHRFVRIDGAWRQESSPPFGPASFRHIDLSPLGEADQQAALATVAAELQASLDLGRGPLLAIASFDLGAGRSGRLVVIVHHLVIDGVSWRILLEDLDAVLDAIERGEEIQLPAKTTSFQRWSRMLSAYARSDAPLGALAAWRALREARVNRLPMDQPGGDNTVASAQTLTRSLSRDETDALLHRLPRVSGARIDDVLLTALAQAFRAWTGATSLLLDLEGHGRETLFDEVDLSRTIGWFTVLFPVLLELGPDDGGPAHALASIQAQLRRIPRHGIDYGLLRYLREDSDLSSELAALPRADVSFDYLGQMDPGMSSGSRFGWAGGSAGPTRSPRDRRSYLVEIRGFVVGGVLQMTWTFSASLHRSATIERLAEGFADALRELIGCFELAPPIVRSA